MITFLYNGQKCYTENLQKKLKRMKITENDIQILEETTNTNKDTDTNKENKWVYYVFKNSKDNYLWGINKPDLDYIKAFGFDISDYILIDICEDKLKPEYYKWNPDTKTGIKN